MSFLSLDSSWNNLRLTVFITEGKIVFHVLILSLVCLGNVYVSGRLSYRHDYMYHPRHTYCITVLVFVCTSVSTTLEREKEQSYKTATRIEQLEKQETRHQDPRQPERLGRNLKSISRGNCNQVLHTTLKPPLKTSEM